MKKALVVRLMRNDGLSAREALDAEGLVELDERTAQRWRKKADESDVVLDGRWLKRGGSKLMTVTIMRLTLQIWNGRSSASPSTVLAELERRLAAMKSAAESRGVPFEHKAPSVSTLRRFLERLPKPVERNRGSAAAPLGKSDAMLGTTTRTTEPNELWVIDTQELKVRIRVLTRSGWTESRVWLTLVLDAETRAVMGWYLRTVPPDAWATCATLYHAIAEKADPRFPMHGKPKALKPDWGPENRATDVRLALKLLGVEEDFAPPHYPNAKGDIESLFSAMQSRAAIKAGNADNERGISKRAEATVMNKMTFAQAVQWIADELNVYHHTCHRSIGVSPMEAWTEAANPVTVEADKLIVLLLHFASTRVVKHCSVSLTDEGEESVYQHEALASWNGRQVLVRRSPHFRETALVYSAQTNECICEAVRKDLVSDDHRRAVDRATQRSTVALTRDYMRAEWNRDAQIQRDYDEAHRPATPVSPTVDAPKRGASLVAARGRTSTKAPELPDDLKEMYEAFSSENIFGQVADSSSP